MEENVALDTTKQKKFIKSIKGIKKLIKKNESEKSEESVSPKQKNEKPKRKRPERGLVYLSHIPHGFYEHEMTQYFKQFGMVTNVRVIRSKRTGISKGYAFVEFKEPAVAEIVAETMNNYLMGKRLIKAAIIPPEKQRPKAMRKHWSRLNNPGKDARLKQKKIHNQNKDEKGDLKRARKILSNINKTKQKLSELGINYDFFTPVDVPEALQDLLNKEENEETNVKDSIIRIKKDTNQEKGQNLESKDNKSKKAKSEKIQVKLEKNKKAAKAEVKESTVKVEDKKSELSNKKTKQNEEIQSVVNKKEQNQKQQKLKEAGVKSVENFIKVQEESGDSDSSLEFDSDEYEKMLEDESGDESDIGDDTEGDEESHDDESDAPEEDDESDEEELVPPPKKSKGKPAPIVALPKKQGKKQKGLVPVVEAKRKVPQKAAPAPVAAKKPKFEKQTQQPIKKHFKKKK